MPHTRTIHLPKARRHIARHRAPKPVRSAAAAFKSHGRRLIELSDETPVMYHHFAHAYVALTNGGQKPVEQFVEDEEETLNTRIDGRPTPIVPFSSPPPSTGSRPSGSRRRASGYGSGGPHSRSGSSP